MTNEHTQDMLRTRNEKEPDRTSNIYPTEEYRIKRHLTEENRIKRMNKISEKLKVANIIHVNHIQATLKQYIISV